jgi:hypothetical protein
VYAVHRGAAPRPQVKQYSRHGCCEEYEYSGNSTTTIDVYTPRVFHSPADMIGPGEGEDDIIKNLHSSRRHVQGCLALGTNDAKIGSVGGG